MPPTACGDLAREPAGRGPRATLELDLLRRGLERIEAAEPQDGEDAALRIETSASPTPRAAAGLVRCAGSAAVSTTPTGTPEYGVIGHWPGPSSAEPGQCERPALADLERRLTDVAHLVPTWPQACRANVADVDLDPSPHLGAAAVRAEMTELTAARTETPSTRSSPWGEPSRRVLELEGDDDRITIPRGDVTRLDEERTALPGELSEARRAAASRWATASATSSPTSRWLGPRPRRDHDPAGRSVRTAGDDVDIGLAANVAAWRVSVTRCLRRGVVAGDARDRGRHGAGDGCGADVRVDEVDSGVAAGPRSDVGARLAALASSAPGQRRHPPRAGGRPRRPPPRVAKSDDGHVTRSGVRRVNGEDRVASWRGLWPHRERGRARACPRLLSDLGRSIDA